MARESAVAGAGGKALKGELRGLCGLLLGYRRLYRQDGDAE
jgi:hypothetical protein